MTVVVENLKHPPVFDILAIKSWGLFPSLDYDFSDSILLSLKCARRDIADFCCWVLGGDGNSAWLSQDPCFCSQNFHGGSWLPSSCHARMTT